MAYKVPDLRYAYDALEPHIDEQTMRLHHDRHHQACATKTADPTNRRVVRHGRLGGRGRAVRGGAGPRGRGMSATERHE